MHVRRWEMKKQQNIMQNWGKTQSQNVSMLTCSLYRQWFSCKILVWSNSVTPASTRIMVLTDGEAARWASILLSKGLHLAHKHCHHIVGTDWGTSHQFTLNNVQPDGLHQSKITMAWAMDDGQFALPQTEGLTELLIQLATNTNTHTHTHNLLLLPLTVDLVMIILIMRPQENVLGAVTVHPASQLTVYLSNHAVNLFNP